MRKPSPPTACKRRGTTSRISTGQPSRGCVHPIGTLSKYGRLGTVRIADSRTGAGKVYRDAVAALDREAQQQ
ncbi:MAG: hypothetical protein M3305_13305 [Actinomycetota bacterium]|nr:hypothetical protein [Actinomycetota bacterium]